MNTDNKEQIMDFEIGDTGTRRFGGYTFEEFIPELCGKNGAEIYDEMRKSNSTISAVLTIMTQLLYKVKWNFKTNIANDKAEDRTRLVETMFNDMEKPFLQIQSDIYTFLVFGHAELEPVWKRRLGRNKDPRFNSKYKDGLWAPRKMPLRSQKTIIRWEFDDAGTPTAAIQLIPINGRQATIPMDRLLHFRTTTEGDLPDGISILRGCYEDYIFVKKIKRLEAINIERDLAGIPFFKIPSELMLAGATDAQKERYKKIREIGENLRLNSQSYVVLPSEVDENGNPKWQFELVKAGGQKLIDTHLVIERYEANIAIQLLADFIHMGAKKAGGTYNLAEVKIKFFVQSLNYYLDVVQEVFNSKLIPQIYEMNNWPIDEGICQMVHGTTDAIDFEVMANCIMKLVQVGAINHDDSLENWLRSLGNMPSLKEEGFK